MHLSLVSSLSRPPALPRLFPPWSLVLPAAQDRNPRAIIPLELCSISAHDLKPDQLVLCREQGAPLKVMKLRDDGSMQFAAPRQLLFKVRIMRLAGGCHEENCCLLMGLFLVRAGCRR